MTCAPLCFRMNLNIPCSVDGCRFRTVKARRQASSYVYGSDKTQVDKVVSEAFLCDLGNLTGLSTLSGVRPGRKPSIAPSPNTLV